MAALARCDTREQLVFAGRTRKRSGVTLSALHSAMRGVAEHRRRIETLRLLRRRNHWNLHSSPDETRQILGAGYGMAQRALLAKHNRFGAHQSRTHVIVGRGGRHLFLHKSQHGCGIGVRRLLGDAAVELQRVAAPARAIEVHRSHAARLRCTPFAHIGDAVTTRAVERYFSAIRSGEIFL